MSERILYLLVALEEGRASLLADEDIDGDSVKTQKRPQEHF